jgi:hypothetical protein
LIGFQKKKNNQEEREGTLGTNGTLRTIGKLKILFGLKNIPCVFRVVVKMVKDFFVVSAFWVNN